jgi:hypothetical protein
LLAAKAKRYAALSSSGVGNSVGDADQFLVDFEQKRYDDNGADRDVDILAALASSDSPCQLRNELESHAANQSSQANAAKMQRDAALQVRLCHIDIATFLCSHRSGAPRQARGFKRAQHMKLFKTPVFCFCHSL